MILDKTLNGELCIYHYMYTCMMYIGAVVQGLCLMCAHVPSMLLMVIRFSSSMLCGALCTDFLYIIHVHV